MSRTIVLLVLLACAAVPAQAADLRGIYVYSGGIYPLGQASALRAQYIEVFPANANAFPGDIVQAHDELTVVPRRRAAHH